MSDAMSAPESDDRPHADSITATSTSATTPASSQTLFTFAFVVMSVFSYNITALVSLSSV
jgi:hypothetical protein